MLDLIRVSDTDLPLYKSSFDPAKQIDMLKKQIEEITLSRVDMLKKQIEKMTLSQIEHDKLNMYKQIEHVNKQIEHINIQIEKISLVQVLILCKSDDFIKSRQMERIKFRTQNLYQYREHNEFIYMTHKDEQHFDVVWVPFCKDDVWWETFKQPNKEEQINGIVLFITNISEYLLPGGYLMLHMLENFDIAAVKNRISLFATIEIENSDNYYLTVQKNL